MSALERVLAALGDRVKVRKANGWNEAQCPAHEDRTASLGVKQGDRGAVLKCQAGCKTEDVAKSLKLSMGDLFDEPTKKSDFKIAATYPYRDESGKVLYEVVRLDPKDFRQRRPNGSGWTWGLGDVRCVPYCLPELLKSAPRAVFVVEGEKDVHSLQRLGLVATTNAGGAGKWRDEFCDYLEGRQVIILPDNDQPGWKHGMDLLDRLSRKGIQARVVQLPGLPAKGDVSDWLAAGGTKKELLALATAQAKPSIRQQLEKLRGDIDAILGGLS